HSRETIAATLLDQAHQCAARLRANDLLAGNVTIKIRAADFRTWTRSHTLSQPTDVAREIARQALELFAKEHMPKGGIRLVGVTTKELISATSGVQLAWGSDSRGRATEIAMDRIHQKFGTTSLRPATLVTPGKNSGAPSYETESD
ncbi:MAG: DNA polymerase IV, partial [Varibaculum cambriense]|nr:DNA polymerase IV [Varibaculum cambriense]